MKLWILTRKRIDKLKFYSTEYTVVDNQSECNKYTNSYCVEILSEKIFKDIQNIEIERGVKE